MKIQDNIDYLKKRYPDLEITGVLVGNDAQYTLTGKSGSKSMTLAVELHDGVMKHLSNEPYVSWLEINRFYEANR